MTDNHYTLNQLKNERSWTETLVLKLLGEPDATRRNPHYKSAPPMRLYQRERVLAAEQSEQWAALAAQVERRRTGSQKAVVTKTAQLLAYVDGLDVRVSVLSMPDVVQSACQHYNNRKEEEVLRRGFYDWRRATHDSDAAFLERITVNYLRHVLSHYDAELARIFGHVGVKKAYIQLNSKVYAAIAAAYPSLASECEQQEKEKVKRKNELWAIYLASAGDG